MKRSYITIKEAAEILEVNPMTLRRWDKKGRLKAFRHPINGYRIYKPEQIKRLANKLKIAKIE